MIEYTTTILQFAEQGEKTGWSYIEVPLDIANDLVPGNKKSFRVKGAIDSYVFEGTSLLPMGGGNFIMPLNLTIRRVIGKRKGAMVRVKLEADLKPMAMPGWVQECLEDEPDAREYFYSLPKSHQNYFIKWIESAKTEPTKIKRITQTVTALSRRWDFGQMIRFNRKDK